MTNRAAFLTVKTEGLSRLFPLHQDLKLRNGTTALAKQSLQLRPRSALTIMDLLAISVLWPISSVVNIDLGKLRFDW